MDSSPTRETRRAYTVAIGICTVVLLVFAVFAATEPSLAAGDFGLKAAAPSSLDSQSSVAVIIGRIVSAALGLVGTVFLLLMLYAGVMWMTARGNADRAEKAKDTITRAVIGLIIIAASYAITSFVITRLTTDSTSPSPSPSSSSSCTDGKTCMTRAECGGDGVGSCLGGKCTCLE